MIAPVAGSGSCPTWIARVSKSMGGASSRVPDAPDPLEAEDAGEAVGGPVELGVDVAADARLAGELPDPQHALGAVGLQIGPPEEAVAGEQRQDVVAVDPLVLALVHLDHVLGSRTAARSSGRSQTRLSNGETSTGGAGEPVELDGGEE